MKKSQLQAFQNDKNKKINVLKKAINVIAKEQLTHESLKKLNVNELRQLIRFHNLHVSISGYNKMRKIDLILSLVSHLDSLNATIKPKQSIKKEIEPPKNQNGISTKSIINHYIKPNTNAYFYFKKMDKQQQSKLIQDIQDIISSGNDVELNVKDKKVVVNELKGRNLKGIVKKGEGMKALNLQKFIESTYKTTPNEIEGYVLDKDLSTTYTKVYYNKELNKGIISERPTHSFYDALTDVYAGFDLLGLFKHPRFINSWKTYDQVENKYGSFKNWVLIGYSLGAIVAEHYKKASQFSEVFLVSKPVIPNDILIGRKPLKNATEIRSKLDAVSLPFKWLQDKADREVLIEPTTINPITEHKQKHIFKSIDPEKELGDENNKTGLGRKELNKMKVKELKSLVKKLGKLHNKKVLVGGKRKGDLREMVSQLM